jgi:branched-chain amino acid transport system permease protein
MGTWFDSNLGVTETILVNMILAASIQVVMRSGVFSLASIGFWAVGAYITANMIQRWSVNYIICLAVSVVIAGVLGFFFAIPLRRLRGIYLGMATVAFDLVMVVAAVNGGSVTGGTDGFFAIPSDTGWLHVLGACAVVAFLLDRLERGRWGRMYEALRLDEQLARSLGIRAVRMRDLAFAISAALGALSGGLYVLTFNTISPDLFGFDLVILALTMVVVGGSGSWLGAYIGAILIGALPTLLGTFNKWSDVAYGGLLILTMVLAPDGFVGAARRGWRVVTYGGRPPALAEEPLLAPAVTATGSMGDGGREQAPTVHGVGAAEP